MDPITEQRVKDGHHYVPGSCVVLTARWDDLFGLEGHVVATIERPIQEALVVKLNDGRCLLLSPERVMKRSKRAIDYVNSKKQR